MPPERTGLDTSAAAGPSFHPAAGTGTCRCGHTGPALRGTLFPARHGMRRGSSAGHWRSQAFSVPGRAGQAGRGRGTRMNLAQREAEARKESLPGFRLGMHPAWTDLSWKWTGNGVRLAKLNPDASSGFAHEGQNTNGDERLRRRGQAHGGHPKRAGAGMGRSSEPEGKCDSVIRDGGSAASSRVALHPSCPAVISVRTVPAPALAAVAAFQVVAGGKDDESLLRIVVVRFIRVPACCGKFLFLHLSVWLKINIQTANYLGGSVGSPGQCKFVLCSG